MKIAHLVAQFYPYFGGAEICVHNVCQKLTEKSHHAIVITTTPGDRKTEFPYEVIHLWSKFGGLLRRIPFLGRFYLHRCLSELQKEYQFDLWQVTGGYPLGIYAVDFFKKHNIPCILRCCGEDIQKFKEINYGYRLDPTIDQLAHKKYPEYDGLIALTPTVQHEYNELSIPDKKIRIIPNGADCVKFKKACNDSDVILKLRKKFNVDVSEKLILTTGRYHPKKGFDQIPVIAEKLKSRGLHFRWIIAGGGTDQLNANFSRLPELGIITTEKFIKTDSDLFNLPPQSLVDLYAAADVYVLPTLIETFGMVLVEAMAAGLPIVTTDAPGVCDVIDDGVTGIKTQVRNSDQITKTIIEVINNKILYNKLSENSKKIASEIYDWNVVTDQYISFYNKIISEHI